MAQIWMQIPVKVAQFSLTVNSQYFFSYQCEPGEVPEIKQLENVSVLFFDNYDPTCDLRQFRAEIICPLNERTQISGTCEQCRRCFDGTAVRNGRAVKRLLKKR